MSNSKTQYRVAFKSHALVNGDLIEKEFSSRWYESIKETEKWMSESDARIITREYIKPSIPKRDL